MTVGAYFANRLVANLLTMGIAKLGAAAPAAVPAASGLGSVAQNYAGVLGSIAAAAIQIPLTLKFVDDPNTKQAMVAGAMVSAVQGVIVNLLKGSAPAVANMLSGDDTAAKLSAMYGLGQGTSIMPRYAPIGMGEYFAPSRAVGEYFDNPTGEYFSTPMGEYFESGVQGLGNYTGNPDLFEAAAGYGAVGTNNTNHIDPSSDLDHQLSIAEAAAGVGQANYEAAAGALPSYEAQAGGLGNVAIVPTTSTWIPGTSDPQIWAGVRAVSRPQEATAETPAGILSTPGGAGILG